MSEDIAHLDEDLNITPSVIGTSSRHAIYQQISKCLQLSDCVNNDDLITKVLRYGRQSLVEIYPNAIRNKELLNILKDNIIETWDTYLLDAAPEIKQLYKEKTDNNAELFDRMVTEAAETGDKHQEKSSQILFLVLQLSFLHFAGQPEVLNKLWCSITTDGIKSIENFSNADASINQDEQDSSPLYLALRKYYETEVTELIEKSNIICDKEFYNSVVDIFTTTGWRSDIGTIGLKIERGQYKKFRKSISKKINNYSFRYNVWWSELRDDYRLLKTNICSYKIYLMIIIGLVLFVAIVKLLVLPRFFGLPIACDLSIVANRDFNHYYGLVNVENPLSYYNAEHGESINSKCHLFYDHIQIFPNGNLLLSKSMIIQARRGAGKTQIRQCIIAKLPRKNHILIKIYGMSINTYLENFVSNIDISEHPHEKIRKYWTKEHFYQVILTEIVSRFINENYFPVLREKQDIATLETRIEMATLITFYSKKYSNTLCAMINLLLHEITTCSIWSLWKCKIPCNNLNLDKLQQQMLSSLTEKHRKIKVKRETVDTEACLKLLLEVHKKTESFLLPYLDRSYRDQIASLLNFLTTLGISTSVIVDSLDESNFFFDKADPAFKTLHTFVGSVANDDVLNLALGNWGEGAAATNSFSFYILIPKTQTKPMNILWSRIDKIPITDLNWNELQLINYVNFIFDYLRSKSKYQCKKLSVICSLLGGRELCINTVKQLRHPRDFHIFFSVFTEHMKTVCTERNPPFNATKEDLYIMLKETKKRLLNETTGPSF